MDTDPGVFGAAVPIAGIAGDQQAAMFGELGVERGAVKTTYGTSGMVDVNTGDFPVLSQRGAYPLILWAIGDQRPFCLEGTVVTAGAAVQWLRDGLGLLASLEETAIRTQPSPPASRSGRGRRAATAPPRRRSSPCPRGSTRWPPSPHRISG